MATETSSKILSARLSVLLLLVFSSFTASEWNQQYGDYRSTNYAAVNVDSDLYNVTEPWNYTYPGQYSYMYNSPAVSEHGIVFLPFLNYKPPSINNSLIYDLQVRATSPNGTIVWVADHLGMDEMCAVIFLTNAVYISSRNMVVIAWTCAAAFPYFKPHAQLVGIDATTGAIKWKSVKLRHANDMSRISATPDVVYASGGYVCNKDGLPLKTAARDENGEILHKPLSPKSPSSLHELSRNVSNGQIYAVSLVDGSIIWSKNYTQVGCTSQTRVYPMGNDRYMVIIPSYLPENVYLGGRLLALDCDSKGSCTEKWLSDIKLCWDTTFAFSDQGILYGGFGFAGNPDLIFGLDIDTGMMVFSESGYCEPGVYPSGPAVDKIGQAYFSCGNRVFAVDHKGGLLWKTDLDHTAGYIFYSDHRFPPAIVPHPNDSSATILVAMNTNSTHLFTLFANNGSLIQSTAITVLNGEVGIMEPPFVAGNRVFWIVDHYYTKFYLFSTPLLSLV